jgi:hypothetical protein
MKQKSQLCDIMKGGLKVNTRKIETSVNMSSTAMQEDNSSEYFENII